jgi:DNA-directed RNA polymerase specialized sigma24 family protein
LPDEALDQLESDWTSLSSSAWSDRMEALHRCVGRLAAPARGLLQMKYGDGMTAPAIATELGRTLNAVYQGLSRIHRSLRECVTTELDRLGTSAEKAVT